MASQITGVSIVCTTVCSGADQRKHQRSTAVAFVKRLHWLPVNSPHKGPVTRKMFLFDDVIMLTPNLAASKDSCRLMNKGPHVLTTPPVASLDASLTL